MKMLIAIALLMSATPVFATDFSANVGGGASGSYQVGEFEGYANSATTGGSMAQGVVNGDGYTLAATANAGAGHAYAGATFGADGLNVATGGESFSFNASGALDGGSGYAQTAGGVGTDYASYAGGNFSGEGFSANLDFSAFADFGW